MAKKGMEGGLVRKREGREEVGRKERASKRPKVVPTFANILVRKGDKYKNENCKLW